uniref:WAT1-related protein n=1 Tax=Salix viminalis TaxID=40686 RepID=A0A6N2K659_SALVM
MTTVLSCLLPLGKDRRMIRACRALTKKFKDGDSQHILSESTQQYSSYCLLSSSLVRKVLDEGINPWSSSPTGFSISALFLGPIGYFWERGSRPKLTFRISCYLFLSAIVGASLTQCFFLIGIQYTSATFSCAFINMVPVVTFIMALPFKMETVHIRSKSGKAKILGALVCVAGAILLTVYRGAPLFNHSPNQAVTRAMDQGLELSHAKRAERWTYGCIALLVGTLLWSSWFVLQSHIGKRYPCQYSSTAIMSFFGAIQSAVLCLSTERSLSIWVLTGKIEIITVLLLGSIFVIIGLYILLWGKNKEMQNHGTRVAQEAEELKEQEPPVQVISVSCGSRCP